MKLAITKSVTVSLAIAAAVALPATMATAAQSSAQKLSPETNICYPVPGYGWVCK